MRLHVFRSRGKSFAARSLFVVKEQPAVGQLGNYDLNSLLAPTSFRPGTRELCRTSRCEGALRDRKLMRCKRQYQL